MFDLEFELIIVMKLLLALVLGGLIGLEREISKHPAGLRTHILVSLGSATFMLVGYYALKYYNEMDAVVDPTRMAAGIVTGIGFLGAGAIMKEGVNVRGLTTAASIWVVAAIGVCVVSELYIAAVATTLITLAILLIFSRVELRIGTKMHHGTLKLEAESLKKVPDKVAHIFRTMDVKVESMEMKRIGGKVYLKYTVELPDTMDPTGIINHLAKEKDIENMEWADSQAPAPS
jgi:putative Mg2+ transporter-C (MgtC) family protein